MDREEIRAQLKDMVTELDEALGKKADVGDEVDIRDGIGLDSLQMVELLFDIEDQLGVRVENHEIPQISTVGSLLDFVEVRLRESA